MHQKQKILNTPCSLLKTQKLFAGNTVSALLLMLVSLLPSCGNQPEATIPQGVLTEENFTELLVDMALAESAVALNIRSVKPQQLDSVYAFDPLNEHGVSRAMYDSTLKFYAANPEKYKQICADVLTRLSAIEASKKGTKADSIVKPRNVLRRF